MFDTPVTIVGNLLTAPEWRRTVTTGTLVVSFKLASTSRRFDRERNEWVDGDSLRVKVACWRRLGENVSLSLQVGDPVVVHGRLYSRDWTDDQGNRRTSYELDATAVGHDLSRGVARFTRRRPAGATEEVNDATAGVAVGGELSEAAEAPHPAEGLPSDDELLDDLDPAIYDTGSPSGPGADDVRATVA